MKNSRGIVWIDGAMRVMQQMTLDLRNGWANLRLNFSWAKAAQSIRNGIPSSWPTQQSKLDFQSKSMAMQVKSWLEKMLAPLIKVFHKFRE